MKIRFRKVTNIRSDHQSLGTAPLGVVYANTLLEVDGVIHEGATVNGDNRWWRDHNGWYYWAGETEVVTPESNETAASPPSDPLTPVPILPLPDEPLPSSIPLASEPPSPPEVSPLPETPLPPSTSVPAPKVSTPDPLPSIEPIIPSIPTQPPEAAVELVALPIPDDHFAHASIPEGEWRSLDGNILPDPDEEHDEQELF